MNSSIGKGEPISAGDFADLTKRWQRCSPDHLPSLFYAFDDDPTQLQTERIVTFFLDAGQMKAIKSRVDADKKNLRFLVYLGLKDGYLDAVNTAPSDPYFIPMLQVRTDANVPENNVFATSWDPEPSFPTNPNESVESGVNAIPGAGAFLFVHYWLETAHADLGLPFESTAYQLGRRVKAFRFQHEESLDMAAQITTALAEGGEKARLCIHLGRGITVSTHPYGFRPIVQITSGVSNDPDSGSSGDDGGSFYDFSNPIPPNDP